MARFHTAVELDSTTVIISNGNSNQTYKKVDLRVSKTHFSVYLLNKNLSTDAIVASWNAEQAFDYGYISLTALEDYLLNLIYGTAIPAHIQSYTAGVADIDFTNTTTGVDSWDILLKIAPTSLQLPSGHSVESYDYLIGFSQAGTTSNLYSGSGVLIDTPLTTTLNGAGAYNLSITYNITDGSSIVGNFTISYLIKVDAVGNVLGSIKNGGNTINSINGLLLSYTANIVQVGVSETIKIGSFNGTSISLLATGASGTVSVPIGSILVATYTTLDPTFWADLDSAYLANPEALNASTSVIIS